MYTIALIDDKDYGIAQVRSAIPAGVAHEFYYFPSYREAVGRHFSVILLDYFLDLDRARAPDIIGMLSADLIIGFSSVESRSDEICRHGGHYSVRKLSSTDANPELARIFALFLT